MTIRTLSALLVALMIAAPATAGALPCPGDLDGNNEVDIDDVVLVILNFGCSIPPAPACPGDADESGIVDIDDVVLVVLNFGRCPTASNDDCASPLPITDGDTIFDTDGTNTDGLAHAACEGDGQIYQDVWYSYTATNTGVLAVSVCGDLGAFGNASYDTDIAIYDDNGPAPCPPTDAQLLSCGDDVCNIGAAYAETPVTVGDQLLIRVGGGDMGDSGSGILNLVCAPASDDFCSTAGDIAVGQTVLIDTTGATADPGSPACGFGAVEPEHPGRWLRCVGDGRNYTLELCNNPPGPFDTRLNVYCGPCGDLSCAVDEPEDNFLACGFNETVTWCTAPGVEYFILVHQDSIATVAVDVTLTAGAACGAPVCP